MGLLKPLSVFTANALVALKPVSFISSDSLFFWFQIKTPPDDSQAKHVLGIKPEEMRKHLSHCECAVENGVILFSFVIKEFNCELRLLANIQLLQDLSEISRPIYTTKVNKKKSTSTIIRQYQNDVISSTKNVYHQYMPTKRCSQQSNCQVKSTNFQSQYTHVSNIIFILTNVIVQNCLGRQGNRSFVFLVVAFTLFYIPVSLGLSLSGMPSYNSLKSNVKQSATRYSSWEASPFRNSERQEPIERIKQSNNIAGSEYFNQNVNKLNTRPSLIHSNQNLKIAASKPLRMAYEPTKPVHTSLLNYQSSSAQLPAVQDENYDSNDVDNLSYRNNDYLYDQGQQNNGPFSSPNTHGPYRGPANSFYQSGSQPDPRQVYQIPQFTGFYNPYAPGAYSPLLYHEQPVMQVYGSQPYNHLEWNQWNPNPYNLPNNRNKKKRRPDYTNNANLCPKICSNCVASPSNDQYYQTPNQYSTIEIEKENAALQTRFANHIKPHVKHAEPVRALFGYMDSNADGVVSFQELQNYLLLHNIIFPELPNTKSQ